MSFNYAHTAATALCLLKKFGRPVTIRSIGADGYDPATATAYQSTTDQAGTGADFAYSAGEITASGGLIKTQDRKLYLATDGITAAPHPNDLAILGDSTWTVIKVDALAPAGVPVLFTLQVRQ